MTFVDTSGWFARFVKTDVNHGAARQWFQSNAEPLLTTDYMICETLTLLRARHEYQLAQDLGADLMAEADAQIYFLSPDDVRATWDIFRRFADKEWSFTDCSSKHVMEKLTVKTAFAFDHHFRQFGTVQVVPTDEN